MRLPFKIAAALAFIAAVPLLMAPTGGYPSFGRFAGAIVSGTLTNSACGSLAANSALCVTSVADSGAINIAATGTPSVNQYPVIIQGNSVAGKSSGLLILAGTNASDAGLVVSNSANNANAVTIFGDGSIGGNLFTTTTQTATATGCTTSPTVSVITTRAGNTVTGYIGAGGISCTSNATSFTLTGALPVALEPTVAQVDLVRVSDSGGANLGCMTVSPGSTTLGFNLISTLTTGCSAFTASGTKGVSGGVSFSYTLK